MSTNCRTPKELAEAVKNNEEYILGEGDLKNKVIRIKAVGKVAWGVCGVSLAAVIILYIARPSNSETTTNAGDMASFFSGIGAVTAMVTLGSAFMPAVAIGIAAGGIGVLNTLRDQYKIIEKGSGNIKLQRR